MAFVFLSPASRYRYSLWKKYYEPNKVGSRGRPHRDPRRSAALLHRTQYRVGMAHLDPFALSQIRSYPHSVDAPLCSASKIEAYERSR